MHDVFISFSFKDQEKADKITNHLTNIYNIPCWICTEAIRAGDYYYDEIADAISTSKVLVFVQTKNSVESKEIPDEVLTAIDEGKTIISFIVEDSELHGQMKLKLKHRQHIDGRKDPLDERIKELAQELCRVLDRPFMEDSAVNRELPLSLSSTAVELANDEVFIGREMLMEEIHAAFEKHNTVFLQGMGGIGKSELAKQYYHKYKAAEKEGYYDRVVFARYNGSFASLVADDLVFNIKGVSRKVKSSNETQSDEEYARDKIDILKKICDSRTLFIIDNFDTDADAEPLFSAFIEKVPYRVLVTTRNAQAEYKTILVTELDDESLKTVFIRYYGNEDENVTRNDPAFTDLFEWTDRHTLTIELIAKYMKNARRITSVRSMLNMLYDKHLTVFSEAGSRKSQKNSYDRIRDIFHISALSEDDIYFLRCLSLMPASGIKYLDFFEKWIHREDDSEFFWDDVLDKLSDLSIVKENKNSGRIHLHPVVREVVLNELKPSYENCKDFIDRCAMVGEDANPLMWGLPYEEKAILLECYTNFLNIITEITRDTYTLYVNISHMYNFVGDYSKAIALHERIYDFASLYFGKNTTEAMLVLNRIGWKNSNCMLYDKALPYYKTATDWFLENPCYTSREAQSAIQNCGNLYYYLYKQTHDPDDLKHAYDYFDKYVAYGEKMIKATCHEPERFKIYLKYQNDCICRDYFKLYIEEQKYDLAKECLEKYKQVVSDFQKAAISPNADMAGYYQHFAKLEYELGHYCKACEALKESYHLYLHYFSTQNPRMISVLEELVMCCIKLNDYEEANKYLSVAIESASAIFTEDHPTLVRLLELQRQIN